MKMKIAKIIVEPIEKTNERWKNALRGKIKQKKREEIISLASWDVMGKLLSPPRLQILAFITHFKPKSIADLARKMKKDFKNIYTDVIFLADLGLIELLEKGPKRTLIPVAKFSEIELPLVA